MIIGLCGVTFCSVNYGVSALAISQICLINNCIKSLGRDAEYFVFSMDRQEAVEKICNSIGINKIRVFESARLKTGITGLLRLRKEISQCDVVFDLTKGDSFSDIYGAKRFILQAIEKRFAINTTKLVISPQTIGPFRKKWTSIEAKYALTNAKLVFTRDDKSSDCVKLLCPEVNVITTSDLAFYLPYNSNEKFSSIDGKTYVGINISGLLWNGGYTGKNEFGLVCDYHKFTKSLIEQLSIQGKYEIILFAHVYMNGGDDDYYICKKVQELYPSVRMAPKFSNPIDAKSFMTRLDLVIGARMHTTIGAISSGTPVLPFSYSRKFEGLFGSLDYNYVIEGTKWDTEKALRFTLDCLTKLPDLNENAKSAVARALEKNEAYRKCILDLL